MFNNKITSNNNILIAIIIIAIIYKKRPQNSEKQLLALPHVCLSAWNRSAPTARIFIKSDISEFLKKSIEKILVWLKSDENNSYLTRRPLRSLWLYLAEFSDIENVSRKNL